MDRSLEAILLWFLLQKTHWSGRSLGIDQLIDFPRQVNGGDSKIKENWLEGHCMVTMFDVASVSRFQRRKASKTPAKKNWTLRFGVSTKIKGVLLGAGEKKGGKEKHNTG